MYDKFKGLSQQQADGGTVATLTCKIAALAAFLLVTPAAAQPSLTPQEHALGAQRLAEAKQKCGKAYPFGDNETETIGYIAKYTSKDWKDTIDTCMEEDAKKSGRQVAQTETKPEEPPASHPACDEGTWSSTKRRCINIPRDF